MLDPPLTWATFLAHPKVIAQIVEARPEMVEQKGKIDAGHLMMGSLRPDQQFSRLLADVPALRRPTVLDAATKNGITALHRAAKNGCAANMEVLLRARAQVDPVRKDNGQTPFLTAVECCYGDCCKLLLRYRADANARPANGLSAIQLAAKTTLEGNQRSGARLEVFEVLQQARAVNLDEVNDISI